MSTPLVLVYQMGKVASVAVASALRRTLPEAEVRRLHFMSETRLEHFVALLEHAREAGDAPFGAMESIVAQTEYGAETRERVTAHLAAGGRVTVVTGVREPVDFAVSAFLQMLAFVSPLAADLHRLDSGFATTLQAVFVDYWTRALAGDPCLTSADRQILPLFTYPQRWFEEELQPLLGIDVYATPFDPVAGHAVFRSAQVDALLFRFEDARRVLPGALGALLGRPPVAVPDEHTVAEKPIAALARAFRDGLRVPPLLAAAAYATRYARHFYTDAERAALRARWCGCRDAGPAYRAEATV